MGKAIVVLSIKNEKIEYRSRTSSQPSRLECDMAIEGQASDPLVGQTRKLQYTSLPQRPRARIKAPT
jgi:hypothetical protein